MQSAVELDPLSSFFWIPEVLLRVEKGRMLPRLRNNI